MLKSVIAAAAALFVAGLAITGTQAADEARVRVIHASPDAPAVDVYANGARVLTDVPFKTSSGYLAVPAGSYTFEVYPTGADPDETAAVLTIAADLATGTDYTVVALDSVAQIKNRVFVDDNAAPAAGKAHVNVIHAGPDAPRVDVAVTGGPVLVSDLGFGSKAGPLPVGAASYDLEVRVAGTTTVALPLPGVELDAGVIYTFVATGYLGDEPALAVVPYTETPAANVTPPSAGDAGLVDGGDNSRYIALGAVALLAAIVFVGVARRVAVRS